ncbi:vitelline membrane protein Vm32E [Drosophila kikkawai]|uniref:Vitelline membrane protein Vm32E n=1 Tax=Drosophila kikkawai TaxID=30033 RepID=A0A6P4JCB6_DROKI|nr:vitelline membrane protein Vm32E [Drosophila kikkawai]
MKFFALIVVSLVAFAGASCPNSGYSAPSSYSAPSGYPAPPCPKNYLFSCQPNLVPVPCAKEAAPAAYGSAGAYSEQMPLYTGYPNQQQYQQYQQRVGSAALLEELRGFSQGIQGQQY